MKVLKLAYDRKIILNQVSLLLLLTSKTSQGPLDYRFTIALIFKCPISNKREFNCFTER